MMASALSLMSRRLQTRPLPDFDTKQEARFGSWLLSNQTIRLHRISDVDSHRPRSPFRENQTPNLLSALLR